jgi:hypothetical protein
MTPWSYRRMIGAVLFLGVAIIVCAPERAFAEVPAQLDDHLFWQFIDEMSEKGGVFTSENPVSNESNFQVVLTRLKERVKPGGVYLGVGPEQNFTYIAALKPSIAFIIDIRRQNLLQHLMYKAIFEIAEDRATFLSLLFSRRRPDGLNEKSTLAAILNAYQNVPADAQVAESNLQRIKDLLVTKHGLSLSGEDIAANSTRSKRPSASFMYRMLNSICFSRFQKRRTAVRRSSMRTSPHFPWNPPAHSFVFPITRRSNRLTLDSRRTLA